MPMPMPMGAGWSQSCTNVDQSIAQECRSRRNGGGVQSRENINRERMSIARECQSRRNVNRGGMSIAEECRSTPIGRGG
jgi:hypothetical protein